MRVCLYMFVLESASLNTSEKMRHHFAQIRYEFKALLKNAVSSIRDLSQQPSNDALFNEISGLPREKITNWLTEQVTNIQNSAVEHDLEAIEEIELPIKTAPENMYQ